jgi:hypothetical protein
MILCVALPSVAASGRILANHTPNYVKTAKNLGTENPSKTIEVSVWLNPHNRGEMDALARQLYDRNSANYPHFLTPTQFAARFAPTAEEAKTVQNFLEGHNLKLVKIGPHNFFVRARGTVGDVELAFHVVLNNYQVRGKVVRANDRNPYVDGAAAPLVRSISGLDTGKYEHPMMARSVIPSQKPGANVRTASAPTPDAFYNNNCFDGSGNGRVLDEQQWIVARGEIPGQSSESAKPDERRLRIHAADDSSSLQSERIVCGRIRREGTNHRDHRLVRVADDSERCECVFGDVRIAGADVIEFRDHLYSDAEHVPGGGPGGDQH